MATRLKPQFIYTTYSGTLYSLTSDNQKDLNIANIHLILGDMWRMKDVFAKLPETLSAKAFYHFENYNIYFSPILFDARKSRGCDKLDSIEVDCFGYKKVSNSDYLALSSSIKPDILVTLTEEPRDDTAGKKSMKRNIKKSCIFLKDAIEYKKANNMKWQTFSSYQGGLDVDLRKEHLEKIMGHKDDVDGVVIYGLYDSDFITDHSIKQKVRAEIYAMVSNSLGEKKIVLSSDGDYLKVLEGWRNGVGYFESTYPFKLSREGKATIANAEIWLKQINNFNDINYQVEDSEIDSIYQKPCNIYSINLIDDKFEKDLSPLDFNCKCYACKNFTKSYINHLLRHREMLANVLLTIHNCYTYNEFFNALDSEIVYQNINRAIKAFWILFTDGYNIKSNSSS